jgi:DNA replication protein DnaC
MNEIYLHRKFIEKKPKAGVISFPQLHTGNDSKFGQIVKRIINKQQQSKTYSLEDIRCIQCQKTVLSERNISTGKWYYPDFNEKIKLCKVCEHLNAIKTDPGKYLQIAGVPQKYTGCAFSNFEATSANKHNLEICRKYTRQDMWHKGLCLYGPVGTGKTHMAIAVFRELLLRGKQGIFTSVPGLLFKIRRAFQANESKTKTEEYYLKEYAECQFLVLDDFGIEKTTDWNRQVLDYIIYERDNHLRPLIITTNLSISDISQKIDIRIASRLAGMGQVLHFTGGDYRTKAIRI